MAFEVEQPTVQIPGVAIVRWATEISGTSKGGLDDYNRPKGSMLQATRTGIQLVSLIVWHCHYYGARTNVANVIVSVNHNRVRAAVLVASISCSDQ